MARRVAGGWRAALLGLAGCVLLGPWAASAAGLNLTSLVLARAVASDREVGDDRWAWLEEQFGRQIRDGGDVRAMYGLSQVAIGRHDPLRFRRAAGSRLLVDPVLGAMAVLSLDRRWGAPDTAAVLVSLSDPQVAVGWLGMLGQYVRGYGQAAAAATYARAVLDIEPSSLDARRRLAEALGAQGDSKGVVATLLEVERLGTLTADDCVLLGTAYLRMGQRDGATSWLLKARDMAPGDGRPPTLLGQIAYSQGRPAEAIQWLEEAVRLTPDRPAARIWLGVYYARAGRWDAARSQLERGLALDPESADAHAGMAMVLNHEGRHAEALFHGRFASERLPDRGDFLAALADAYAGLGQREAAQAAYLRLQDHREYEQYARSRLMELQGRQ